MPKTKLDQAHYKEALDRCISVSKIIREVLLTHPVIEQNEPASHLIQGAVSEVDATAQLVIQKAVDNDGMLYNRALWIFELFDTLLVQHPVITKDHEATMIAIEASDGLWKLYRYLADKTFNIENSPQSQHKPASKKVRK